MQQQLTTTFAIQTFLVKGSCQVEAASAEIKLFLCQQ